MSLKIIGKVSDEEKHSMDVTSLIWHHGYLYSGSDDGKVIRWDDNLKKSIELNAHSSSVYSLAAIGDTVYSCSNDGTVHAWTVDLQSKSIVMKDECEFWKLFVHNSDLFVGDDIGTMRILRNGECIHRYETLEGVKEIAVHGENLYTAKDLDVIICEMGTGAKHTFTTRKTIQGRAPFCIIGDKLVISARSGKDILVHEDKGNFNELTQVKDAHEMIVNALVGNKRDNGDLFVYTAGWDKVLKEWKLEGSSCYQTQKLDLGIVTNSILIRNDVGYLYAGGSDGHIFKVQLY